MVSALGYRLCQIVIKDELSVPKNLRRHAKERAHLIAMELYLLSKFLARVEEGERVVVSLGEELHSSSIHKTLEGVHDVEAKALHLLHKDPRKRVAHAELRVLGKQREHHLVGGQV